MRWLELSIEADVEAVEAVSEILGRVADGTAVHPTRLIRDPNDELAASADPSSPFVVTAHLSDGPAAPEAIESTERALWHLQAFGLRPLGALRVRAVDDVEWTDAWKEHYATQRIGRVVIAPSWAPEEPARPDDVVITLDPGMAFGTGLHPTTRGCLGLLQSVNPMPDEVLDVGCGSGVLAIAALRLGARRAVGIDTDALAVEATRENAGRNGLADAVEVRHGTLDEDGERYPLVLANLVAAVLVELAPRLADHLAHGGVLLASGIIEPRAEEVVAAMERAGLAVTERRDDGEWVSVRLEHAP
ncbi:MAG: 50S ribosomal protein L11 methyltransferase [Chloroflexi bacterium]|nr:50S ribosomal protein L11 methyltransferase [Chloroflexota bacterium]